MKLIAWLALVVAVLANVVANVALKYAVRKTPDSAEHFLTSFFTQTWTWIGLCAGGILLASYLLAIRSIGLGISYAVVTSAALVLVTISAAVAFHERISAATIVGMGLIMLGIAVLAYTQVPN
jgi:small multidrug resistance pump